MKAPPRTADDRPDWRGMDRAVRDDLLRRYVAAGLSASVIADRFDRCSRSAVVGLAHRLKLQLHGRPVRRTPRPAKPTKWAAMNPREKDEAVKRLILSGKSWREIAGVLTIPNPQSIGSVVERLRKRGEIPPAETKGAVAAKGQAVVRAKAVKPRPPASTTPIVVSRAVAFEPLPGVEPVPFGSPGCKFAVDGLNGRGLLWCGAPRDIGSPWCATHRHIAFNPSPLKRF